MKATRKKTTKTLTKLTCLGSTSSSYMSDAQLVVSLLGGNRNHVTTNCENPQLRNAQLPGKALTFYACAKCYISCGPFTAEGRLLGHSPPVKIQTTNTSVCACVRECARRAHKLKGRASGSRLREPGFDSCDAVLKPWVSLFTLHCSSSLCCINEYLAIDRGGYVYEQP